MSTITETFLRVTIPKASAIKWLLAGALLAGAMSELLALITEGWSRGMRALAYVLTGIFVILFFYSIEQACRRLLHWLVPQGVSTAVASAITIEEEEHPVRRTTQRTLRRSSSSVRLRHSSSARELSALRRTLEHELQQLRVDLRLVENGHQKYNVKYTIDSGVPNSNRRDNDDDNDVKVSMTRAVDHEDAGGGDDDEEDYDDEEEEEEEEDAEHSGKQEGAADRLQFIRVDSAQEQGREGGGQHSSSSSVSGRMTTAHEQTAAQSSSSTDNKKKKKKKTIGRSRRAVGASAIAARAATTSPPRVEPQGWYKY